MGSQRGGGQKRTARNYRVVAPAVTPGNGLARRPLRRHSLRGQTARYQLRQPLEVSVDDITRLFASYDRGTISRRHLLQALGLAAVGMPLARAFGQGSCARRDRDTSAA